MKFQNLFVNNNNKILSFFKTITNIKTLNYDDQVNSFVLPIFSNILFLNLQRINSPNGFVKYENSTDIYNPLKMPLVKLIDTKWFNLQQLIATSSIQQLNVLKFSFNCLKYLQKLKQLSFHSITDGPVKYSNELFDSLVKFGIKNKLILLSDRGYQNAICITYLIKLNMKSLISLHIDWNNNLIDILASIKSNSIILPNLNHLCVYFTDIFSHSINNMKFITPKLTMLSITLFENNYVNIWNDDNDKKFFMDL